MYTAAAFLGAVKDGAERAWGAATRHPYAAGGAGAAAATAAFAPGALSAGATAGAALLAANPFGLGVATLGAAAVWAAKRYLPHARRAADATLHATPDAGLVAIEASIRNLTQRRPISPAERDELVDLLTTLNRHPNLLAQLRLLEPLPEHAELLNITEECHAAMAEALPTIQAELTASRGTIPQMLHHFHAFLGSLMQEATPALRLAYSSLNDLLAQSRPTQEQWVQARNRFASARDLYTSHGAVPAPITAAIDLLNIANLPSPLTEAQKDILRAGLHELDRSIRSQSGEAERLIDKLTYHVFGETSGLMPQVRAELGNLLLQAPPPLLNAANRLNQYRWTPSDTNREALLTALQALEAPSENVTLLITALAGEGPLAPPLMGTVATELDALIQARQGIVWNQLGALRAELTNPDRGLLKETIDLITPLMTQFTNNLHTQLARVMDSVSYAARRAPEALYRDARNLQFLIDALDQGTPRSRLQVQIQAITPLIHNATTLNKTALQEALRTSLALVNQQIAAQSGPITQAIRSAGGAAQEEVTSLLARTSQALSSQVQAWVRQGKQLIARAPDHPMKSLFERILDAHTPGGAALDGTLREELGRVEALIPNFRTRVLERMGEVNIANDPEHLMQACFHVMREIVQTSTPEQQNLFYGSIYEAARKEAPSNPDIRGDNWGEHNAFLLEKPALTFYGFAEWHKKVFHFTEQPLYRLRTLLLTIGDAVGTPEEKNGRVLEALNLVPIDGFRDLVLGKMGGTPLAQDPTVTLERIWDSLRDTVNGLTAQEQSFFYSSVSEVSARNLLETNGEAWARAHSFEAANKERAFAGFSWFMVKRAGGAQDVGHRIPPGIVGAQLGVGGGITAHPVFGVVLQGLEKVPTLGLGGVTSFLERILQNWLNPAVGTDTHGTTPEQKIEIQGVIAQAIERLRQAHEIGSLPGYVSALKGAFGSLSKYPLLINGLQFNLGSSEPLASTYEREAALLREVEGLDRPEPGTPDDPASWRAKVDAEKRMLEQNGRFMILYKVFYEEPRFGVGEDNPKALIDAAIKRELTASPGSPEYDAELERLRNERGYYTAKTPNHFHTMMEKVLHLPDAQKEDAFKKVLFEEIGKKSALKGFFNQIFYWVLNSILKNILGPYLSNIITSVRQGVRSLEEAQGKAHPIPSSPMNQLTSGMLAIRKAYAEWGKDSRGQYRDGRVKVLLDKPEYNQGMDPKTIHDKTATTLIDHFIPTTQWDLKTSLYATWGWITKEVSPNPWINHPLVALKVLFIALPGSILTPLYDFVTCLFGTVGTVIKRYLLEKTVIRLDVVPTLVATAKDSLYDASAYQLALNELLCEQLKEVWGIMDPSREGQSETSKKYLEIAEQQPESTRVAIRGLVENLFSTMQLRSIQTPEAMLAATTGGGSLTAKAREQLNSLFLPDVVDNVVKLIMVGFQSVVQKDQMEKQLAQAMRTINGAMVGVSSNHESWSPEDIRQRNHSLSRAINHYKDLILSQAIKEAVDAYLTTPEKKQIDAAKTRFEATKALLIPSFIPTFRRALDSCDLDPSPTNVNKARLLLKDILHELSDSSRILQADIQQGKISQATANHIQAGRAAIITELEVLSREFSATFHSHLALQETTLAVPKIRDLLTIFGASPLVEDQLQSASILVTDLKKITSPSADLQVLIRHFETTLTLAKEALHVEKEHAAANQTLTSITLMIQELQNQKTLAFQRTSPIGQLTHDGVERCYTSLTGLIDTLPETFDKLSLKAAAKTLADANSATTETQAQTLRTYIDRVRGERAQVAQEKQTALASARNGYTPLADAFITAQEAAQGGRTVSRAEHLTNCRARLDALETATNSLTPPPFIATNLHDLSSNSSVNRWICNMIFQELKVRSGQFLGMVSDPIVFQQMIRQGMLFVLEKLKTPQEFAELTKRQ